MAGKRYRSAVTGRFITAREALARPARSVAEAVKRVVAKLRKT